MKLSVIFRTSCICLIAFFWIACEKGDEESVKSKAPLHDYWISARLNNKDAGTTSTATGILKGSYSESSKEFSYAITFDSVTAQTVELCKGARGVNGSRVIKFSPNDGELYKSPLKGKFTATALQQRDLVKGLWYILLTSKEYKAGEIRGQITLKQKQ
ncbi:CHRD domain-containing protein [Pedobacter sp. HMF7647]|uniref:CHRD domain-containing protein n=1 Tax=Hufsiella arboris TaxID=2695275 RepID=A0A7K1YAI0_9SPHI|nr:CHRD domain-containing protein [Hufsiella arboris]MXV51587.1 CHRD domain-containing protein [Hufsiella arboris]